MLPTEQTIYSGPRSNCFQACLASVLEVPIERVPNFAEYGQGDWFGALNSFLRSWGLGAIMVGYNPKMPSPPGYSLLTVDGIGPKKLSHVVVALDGEIVWDPSNITRKLGTGEKRYWVVITVRDPAVPSLGTRSRSKILPQIFSGI